MRRLAHNSLSLKRNLQRRGIDRDTRCVFCRRLDEDGAHLFLKCKEMIAVWKELGLEDIRQRMCSYQHAGAMLEEIMKLDKKKQISVCCLLWRWWTRRNKINHHEKVGELFEVIG
jgi:hypothetical protein